jgi:hypothetical protein
MNRMAARSVLYCFTTSPWRLAAALVAESLKYVCCAESAPKKGHHVIEVSPWNEFTDGKCGTRVWITRKRAVEAKHDETSSKMTSKHRSHCLCLKWKYSWFGPISDKSRPRCQLTSIILIAIINAHTACSTLLEQRVDGPLNVTGAIHINSQTKRPAIKLQERVQHNIGFLGKHGSLRFIKPIIRNRYDSTPRCDSGPNAA